MRDTKEIAGERTHALMVADLREALAAVKRAHTMAHAVEDADYRPAVADALTAHEVATELADYAETLRKLTRCPATHLRTEGIPAPFTVHCERAAGHPMPHRVMDYEWSS